jgi:hypothetical protein
MTPRKDLSEVSEELLAQLRSLGDDYGPMGVALVAAELTDMPVLLTILTEEVSRPGVPQEPLSLVDELQTALNRHSAENGSNTPDFILARYLERCLLAFDDASVARETWYGQRQKPGVP